MLKEKKSIYKSALSKIILKSEGKIDSQTKKKQRINLSLADLPCKIYPKKLIQREVKLSQKQIYVKKKKNSGKGKNENKIKHFSYFFFYSFIGI